MAQMKGLAGLFGHFKFPGILIITSPPWESCVSHRLKMYFLPLMLTLFRSIII